MHGGGGHLDDLMEPRVLDLELLEAVVCFPTLEPAIRDDQRQPNARAGKEVDALCQVSKKVGCDARRRT